MSITEQILLEHTIRNSNSKLAKEYLLEVFRNQERIFMYKDDQKYSGRVLLHIINEFCNSLKKDDKDVVIIKSINSIEWVLFYLSAKIMNKVIFVISEENTEEIFDSIQKNFGVSIIFKNNNLILENSSAYSKQTSDLSIFDKDIAYDCIFTTGTTGTPKGVIIKEDAYLHTAESLIKKSKQHNTDIELLSMPFSHSFGLARLRVCLFNKQSFHVSDGLRDFPKIYKKFIDKKINGLALVPSAIEIIKLMLRNNSSKFGSCVKYFEIGSSSLSIDSRKWLKENFTKTHIFHHYGMTEASRSFFIDRGEKDKMNKTENYVGEVSSDSVKFKLKYFNNKRHGEILIKGPHLAEGYLVLDEQIKFEKINGWFHTNDFGLEEKNKLILLGRMNSMINVGGQKVYAEEIEDSIEKIYGISSVICTSIKDNIMGEVPAILVQIDKDVFTSDNDAAEEIKIFTQSLQTFKRPRAVVFTECLPLTKGGKKIRNKKLMQGYFKT